VPPSAFRLPRLVVAAFMLTLAACQRGPAVPELAGYGTLEPAVAAVLTERLTALSAARTDADQWGRLAMALEANGLTPQAKDTYAVATTLPATHGRWWYHLARLRARDGDTAGALAAYDETIARSPDYVPARWRRGQVLFDRGDMVAAEAAFRVAVNLAPVDSAGVTGLARVQMAQGKPQDAAATLETLLDRTPDDRYAYQVLGTAYRALGRAGDAAEATAAGASGEPRWLDPWASEVGVYRRGFAAMLKEATTLGLEGQHAEAIALLERLRTERPDDRELTVYLGGLYATAGRTADARPLLEGVLRAFPDDFDATMNLATAHLFDRAWDDADRLAARALDLRPRDADATRLRGVVAWRRGALEDAERWLGEAAAANPSDAKALAWIGSIRLERRQAARALAAYREALARDPLLGDALVGGASAALAAGAVDDAARWAARARKVAPTHSGLADVEQRLAAAGKGRS
jgi:tetratricopeptide (TPR) repeat protein